MVEVAWTQTIEGLTSVKNLVLSIVAKSANYTVTDDDTVILGTGGAGGITVTLPTAVGRNGRVYKVKKVDAAAGAVTVDAAGSETIDGALTKVLSAQFASVTIISDNVNWHIID